MCHFEERSALRISRSNARDDAGLQVRNEQPEPTHPPHQPAEPRRLVHLLAAVRPQRHGPLREGGQQHGLDGAGALPTPGHGGEQRELQVLQVSASGPQQHRRVPLLRDAERRQERAAVGPDLCPAPDAAPAELRPILPRQHPAHDHEARPAAVRRQPGQHRMPLRPGAGQRPGECGHRPGQCGRTLVADAFRDAPGQCLPPPLAGPAHDPARTGRLGGLSVFQVPGGDRDAHVVTTSLGIVLNFFVKGTIGVERACSGR